MELLAPNAALTFRLNLSFPLQILIRLPILGTGK